MPTLKLTPDGKVVLQDGLPSCVCCGAYTVCVDNTNAVLDNGWDIEINGNFVGYYDGAEFTNQCFEIPEEFLVLDGPNTVLFRLVTCQSDDYWVYEIKDPSGNVVLSGSHSGGYCPGGVSTGDEFSDYFTLP